MHEKVNHGAEKSARDERLPGEKTESAAGCDIRRGGDEGNGKMESRPEESAFDSSAISVDSERAAGHRLRNQDGPGGRIDDDGVHQVKNAGGRSTQKNREPGPGISAELDRT